MKNRAKKLFLVLLCLGTAWSLSAQTTIKGIVTDDAGEPLIGAGVVIEGTQTGTVTGIDGDYTLEVPAEAVNLVFSFIGLETKTVAIDGRTQIDVVLGSDQNYLDEVVVVGYATVKRRDLLGSVSSVSSDKLAEQPVNNISQALSGKMAGVSVTTTEGDPDADIKIRVRGGGSITQQATPLYIVDGFPMESISDIPSSEIQSIDVLKDAFSTAIYGSRGANGVIIVTTKDADKGSKVSVSLNSYYGLKWMANKNAIRPMNVENFVKFQYENALLQNSISSKYEPYFGGFSDIDQYAGMVGNDWIDAVFGRTGSTFATDFSVSGSGDNVNWTLGYAHIGDKAIMVGSDYVRDNLNFKTKFKTSKTTSIDASIRYSRVKVNGAGANSLNDKGAQSGNGRLKHAVQYTPIPVNTIASEDDEADTYGDNVRPLQSIADNDSKRLRTSFNANVAFNWEIVDNLRLKIEGGMEDWRQSDDRFYGLSTKLSAQDSKVPGTNSNNHIEVFRTRYRNTNTLNYDFKNIFNNEDHKLTAMLGQELTVTKSNTLDLMVYGFPTFFSAQQAWNFMSQANGTSLADGTVTNNTDLSNVYAPNDVLLSFFTRVNYDYKNRYMIGATFRADGSSKFSNPWGFFPSAAVAWTISNEDWMAGSRGWLDLLKIRYSFGTAGNNNIPLGQLSKEYASTGTSYISTSGNIVSPKKTEGKIVMNNPDLKWETTYTHNIGLDFGLFKGKLNGSIEVYQNDTKDLLINFPISGAGYSSQYRNAGSVRNRGAELTLNAPIVSNKDFGLNLSANISYNKNVVTSLAGLENIPWASGWVTSAEIAADYLVQEGQPLGNMYGFENDGFYTVDDFVGYEGGKWILKEGVADDSEIIGTNYVRPGAMKLKNTDGSEDNKVTSSDMTIIGNAMPDFTGGFSLSGYFKGFDFSANFNYVIGNDIYNANKIEFTGSSKYFNRNLLDMMNVDSRWTNVNWETGELINDADALASLNAGRTMWNPTMQKAVFTDWAVEDGSFLRLQSATIGYNLPETMLQKVYLKKARIYVTGTNLWCLTKYSGYDPEVDTRRKTPLTPGVDYSAYPKSIGFVAGVNLTF